MNQLDPYLYEKESGHALIIRIATNPNNLLLMVFLSQLYYLKKVDDIYFSQWNF